MATDRHTLETIRSTEFEETNALLAIFYEEETEARSQLSEFNAYELEYTLRRAREYVTLLEKLVAGNAARTA